MIKKLRTNILPKTIGDILTTLFLTLVIPMTYLFELWIVLPDCHEIGSLLYYVHHVLGIFILHNVLSNMLAAMLSDTSIRGELLQPPADPKLHKWRLCTVCETLAPARSWHCNVCKTCILKRDHHCSFTGYCIGHYNHRYFMLLIFYLFIATAYAFVYNTYYLWFLHGDYYRSSVTVFKLIFPLAMFLVDVTNHQYYLLLYLIGTIGMFFTGFLLFYHGRIIAHGSVVHERRTNPKYDLGLLRNIKMVFGERWYLTWITPLIQSKLPHNGIDWTSIAAEAINSDKNN